MRVIFMGTPDFAVGTLEEIIKAGHEVVLVVSQPDKAVGRSKALKYTPVKECAVAHGIEVYQPAKIRAEESVEYLRQYNADIIIVEAFGQIPWCSPNPVGSVKRGSGHRRHDHAYG